MNGPDYIKSSIHDMPENERPRERLLFRGAAALSIAELLAIILRTGTADENALRLGERILAHYGGLDGIARASVGELLTVKGLGDAKVAQLMAALELGRRMMTQAGKSRPVVEHSADAAAMMADMQHLVQEHVRVILLNSARQVLAVPTIYMGTVNASVLRPAEIFREAIIRNSAAFYLVHNHPSGDPSPSPDDVELTRRLDIAAKLLDINLIDHLIIAQEGWVSLKALGLALND